MRVSTAFCRPHDEWRVTTFAAVTERHRSWLLFVWTKHPPNPSSRYLHLPTKSIGQYAERRTKKSIFKSGDLDHKGGYQQESIRTHGTHIHRSPGNKLQHLLLLISKIPQGFERRVLIRRNICLAICTAVMVRRYLVLQSLPDCMMLWKNIFANYLRCTNVHTYIVTTCTSISTSCQ